MNLFECRNRDQVKFELATRSKRKEEKLEELNREEKLEELFEEWLTWN